MAKILVAFFSRNDENYVGYNKKFIEVGHTEVAANKIRELVDADLFKITMKKPYSEKYDVCMAESRADLDADARPELVSMPVSIDRYDTIILAYPNYWGTMPMAVFTFLEAFDFSGKTILPLCTNEGSDMGKSEEHIKKLCPGAKLGTGLPLCGSGVEASKPFIENWLRENGVI
ncbi:MAG: flavodoxin [Clostridia bacterium]|nr:flavodoxin [Clostridia bacterium]